MRTRVFLTHKKIRDRLNLRHPPLFAHPGSLAGNLISGVFNKEEKTAALLRILNFPHYNIPPRFLAKLMRLAHPDNYKHSRHRFSTTRRSCVCGSPLSRHPVAFSGRGIFVSAVVDKAQKGMFTPAVLFISSTTQEIAWLEFLNSKQELVQGSRPIVGEKWKSCIV